MEGCGEEMSLEKSETPQTHPKPQSPPCNFLNFSTIRSTTPNFQSSKIALEEMCVSVQSRVSAFFCVKPAAFAFQLSLRLQQPGLGRRPAWSEQVPRANVGKRLQPVANDFIDFILPFLKSEQDQLTPVTRQHGLTSMRELCSFCRACFTLSQSQEVWGVEEDKNQVSKSVKVLLCCFHKAVVSSMARSDDLVR